MEIDNPLQQDGEKDLQCAYICQKGAGASHYVMVCGQYCFVFFIFHLCAHTVIYPIDIKIINTRLL